MHYTPLLALRSWSPRECTLGLIALGNGLLAVTAFFGILVAPLSPLPQSASSSTTINGIDVMTATYIDLTHTVEPGMPLWGAFAQPAFGPASAASPMEGFIDKGEAFSYDAHGFVAGAYTIATDQIGTQLDAPAHWNEYGATLSDLPATVAVRPLAVVDITPQVAKDPGYHATAADVLSWEKQHGRVPAGSAVFFRSGWGLKWDEYTASGEMPASFPGVSLDALKFLHLNRSILVHGHEPLDTDMTPSLEGEAWLMHKNFLQVEGAANLHKVPPSGCLLSIGFAKLAGAAGGMARLIAICPPESQAVGETVAEAPGAPLPTQAYPLRRGADGVLKPTPGATPTTYCAKDKPGALGCPKPY